MRETLVKLVERSGADVLSVVGLAKNSGKTTTLLYLVKHLGSGPGRLALTSTGRDGEAIDEITRRQKPRVTITRGTLATTGQQSLPAGEGLSVVRETPYVTATGKIVVVRADRTCRVVLEGPATAAEMGKLVTDLVGARGGPAGHNRRIAGSDRRGRTGYLRGRDPGGGRGPRAGHRNRGG